MTVQRRSQCAANAQRVRSECAARLTDDHPDRFVGLVQKKDTTVGSGTESQVGATGRPVSLLRVFVRG